MAISRRTYSLNSKCRNLMDPWWGHVDPRPTRERDSTRIMYIEQKAGELTGRARIGRVTFSRTGKTLYYQGQRFRSLKGAGFKSNYCHIETGDDYWISGCKRDGSDRLYGERLPIEIDDDVREEYWTEIRNQPENRNQTRA